MDLDLPDFHPFDDHADERDHGLPDEPLDPFERRWAITAFGRLLASPAPDLMASRRFDAQVTDLAATLGLPHRGRHPQRGDKTGLEARDELIGDICDMIGRELDEPEPEPSPVARTLAAVADLFRLDETDRRLLEHFARTLAEGPATQLQDMLSGWAPHRAPRRRWRATGWLLGLPVGAVERAMATTGRLFRSGLLRADPDGDVGAARGLRRIMREGLADPAAIRAALLGPPAVARLDMADFSHLPDAALAARLAARLMDRPEAGAHILIHGEYGAGKTELAKAIAAAAGATLYSAGVTDEAGGEPSRGERMGAYRMLLATLPPDGRNMILVDEADDWFRGEGGMPPDLRRMLGEAPREAGSKAHLHHLLEEAAIPTLWVVNAAGSLSRGMIRRMRLAVHVPAPPVAVRARMAAAAMAADGLAVSAAEAAAFVAATDAGPAIACAASRTVALVDGDVSTAIAVASGLQFAIGRLPPPARPAGPAMRLDLLNAGLDLDELARRIGAAMPCRFAALLQGPPGTGKSELARELARRLKLPVLEKRASDLLSAFVGDSEQRIAAAFAEARATRALLVLDEVDGLLADRRGAERSWEVTQVNEMLTWLEAHPLPVIGTTNLIDRIDQAALRRFDLKLELAPLNARQAAACFEHYFGTAHAAAGTLEGATPGEFAAVRRRALLTGEMGRPDTLLRLVAAERDLREGGTRRAIGFGR